MSTTTERSPAGPSLRPGGTYKLPGAPTDADLYTYFGRQHRWFIWMRTAATLSAATSLLLFSNTMVMLWWFWIPFSIFASYMVLTHYCTTRARRTSKLDHLAITELWEPAVYPAVDVFLPCAGEDLDVLQNTYKHVIRLSYPGEVNVYVLDDGDREGVRQLASTFNFTYLVRPNRGFMKKAGNLKYGYERSSGDYIVIFDADFVPRPDFLMHTLPYFDEYPDIGIVQTPQYFDTSSDIPWLQRCAGTVQESFYRWAQVSRDKLGAPICVGTCAVYRRAGLEKSGGFAQIGHSEDVHTGVNLMKVGYRVQYVPVVLAKGLCPDKLSSFISQQYRWCAGSMSLLRDRSFHDSPLTYRQRMCFFTGFGYYISTAIGVFTLPLPTIVMLWFLPERVKLSNFFWLIPTFVMYPLIRRMHRSGWTPATIRVYTISSFSHAAAIWHTLWNRTSEWVPTGETKKTSMTTRVTAILVCWMGTANIAMFGGVVHFIITRHELVDVSPILLLSSFNWFVWAPIARLAWREHRLLHHHHARSEALLSKV